LYHAARQQHPERVVGRLFRLVPYGRSSGDIEACRKYRKVGPTSGEVRLSPAQLADA
jgi:hypothetical protein